MRQIKLNVESTISLAKLKEVLRLLEDRKNIIKKRFRQLKEIDVKEYGIPKVVVNLMASYIWHPHLLCEDKDEGELPQTTVVITAMFDLWTRNQAVEHLEGLAGRTQHTVFQVIRRFAPVYDPSAFFFHRMHAS